MEKSRDYASTYSEQQCIGRGNFGAAYVVTHKRENVQYIAKKVLLEGLQAKE